VVGGEADLQGLSSRFRNRRKKSHSRKSAERPM
jgi:hypothetical protein